METWKTLAFDEDLIVRGGQHSDLALAVIVASEPGSKPGQWINEVACGIIGGFLKWGGYRTPSIPKQSSSYEIGIFHEINHP